MESHHDGHAHLWERIWNPHSEVDTATRDDVERFFRERAARQRRPDGEFGVFAVQPILAGTILIHQWHDAYYVGMFGWVALTVAEINSLPPVQRALFHRYGLDRDFGVMFGPLDHEHVTTLDNFINHSCDPNLGYDAEGNVVARRDLTPGDELFIDYGEFVVNYDEPFTCQCGASWCRTHVTRNDWQFLASQAERSLPPFIARRLRAAAA